MNLLWVLVIVLIIFSLLGAPGLGPFHHNWGYYPSGLGLVLVIVLVVLLLR